MYERMLVQQLQQRISEKRQFIQIVIGARQTGKTTALTQILKNIKLPIHFVSADDTSSLSREWLNNEWEQARLLRKHNKTDIVLIIDEIQKISDWSSIVKQLWDEDSRNQVPIKVILTGSSSLLLQDGLTESLMGRFEILYSHHWNFGECRQAFDYSLDDFLFFGGYPGAAALKNDEERWARYIGASIVEPTISQDILMMEEIRKPALLRSLFKLGTLYSAQELSYTKIMGQLLDAGNTVTIAHYLELLDKANILCGLQKFSLNKIKVRQSSPRFMVYDTALMTYSDGASRVHLLENPIAKGHLVESAVGAYLLARGQEEGFDVFWWRERGDEVDFVLQKGAKITAIEVKSGNLKKGGGSLIFKKLYPQTLCFTIGSPNFPLVDFLLGKFDLFY
jgi:predicted AAA+ superfamily ATPase